ncbi:hypothetical protein FO519_001254, partial [Halicephalobus sp. NKZ332]
QWRDTKIAAIVDFMPKEFCYPRDVKDFLLGDGCVPFWDDIHSDLFSKCCGEKRLEIAKKWLQEWDLLSKIDEAAALIKNERDQMKMLENGFTRYEELIDTVTDDLEYFIPVIKDNVKNLISALGLSE